MRVIRPCCGIPLARARRFRFAHAGKSHATGEVRAKIGSRDFSRNEKFFGEKKSRRAPAHTL
jgi:hypothetical protein